MWNWLKANDIPNWIVIFITFIVWPALVFYWKRKTVNNVPHLEVRLSSGNIEIGPDPHNAVAHNAVTIEVMNHTGAVVYLSGARIKRCSSLFSVPIDAGRDIAEGTHHLSFMDQAGHYIHRELTLQTNANALASIAVTSPLSESFYRYRAPWYRRLCRLRKYFVLEYTAMVGTRRYFVATLY
ncbi:MAG: hypothetical protein ABSE08_05400 [Syntrophobacteraceae bacterium]